jgi:hypothetical protein
MARLIIFDQTVRGVELGRDPLVLGRSRQADIPIRDRLLSRRHCILLPTREGSSIVDLNSSNGTFLNGVRVEKEKVNSEDIIEIGNTVMVLLDDTAAKRVPGRSSLRNPAKAKELMLAIERRDVGQSPRVGATAKGGSPAASGRKLPRPLDPEVLELLRGSWTEGPLGRELLEAYIANKLLGALVRRSPELRRRVASVLRDLLGPEVLSLEPEAFRARVASSLAEAGRAEARSGGPPRRRAVSKATGGAEPGAEGGQRKRSPKS